MGNEPSSENLQEIKLYRASESFKNNFWNNQWYPVEENLSFKRICNYWKDGIMEDPGYGVPYLTRKYSNKTFDLQVYSTITEEMWNSGQNEYYDNTLHWHGFATYFVLDNVRNFDLREYYSGFHGGLVMILPNPTMLPDFQGFKDNIKIEIDKMSKDKNVALLSISIEDEEKNTKTYKVKFYRKDKLKF
jgi:hypothetical protein